MAAINANSISWQCQWPYYASGFHKGTKPIHSHKVVHEKNTCNVISTVATVACCGWYKFAAREILYLQRKSFCLLFIIPFFISLFSLGHSRAAATRIQLHHRTIAVVVLLYQTKKKKINNKKKHIYSSYACVFKWLLFVTSVQLFERTTAKRNAAVITNILKSNRANHQWKSEAMVIVVVWWGRGVLLVKILSTELVCM